MPGPDLPEIPEPLKGIQHYLKIASQHDERDPVVSYWVRLYSLQAGLKISTKTTAENNFLLKLMDWLETTKKLSADNEAITNEVAAQAHLDNWALKLFAYAYEKDKEGIFNKSVIQSFYTAGFLYDVLTTFGELTEEATQNRKYAKWKATYIHNCLKNGETPVPGPMKEEGKDDDNSNFDVGPGPAPHQPTPPPSTDAYGFPSVPGSATPQAPDITSYPSLPAPVTPNPYNPTPTPTSPGIPTDFSATKKSTGGATLSPDQLIKASKYIKWAGSAINYDDVTTAIDNLQKALHLLTTGQDS